MIIIKLITAGLVILAIFVVFCYRDLKKDREDHNKLFNEDYDHTDQF